MKRPPSKRPPSLCRWQKAPDWALAARRCGRPATVVTFSRWPTPYADEWCAECATSLRDDVARCRLPSELRAVEVRS
jgi:hypothetical protein